MNVVGPAAYVLHPWAEVHHVDDRLVIRMGQREIALNGASFAAPQPGSTLDDQATRSVTTLCHELLREDLREIEEAQAACASFLERAGVIFRSERPLRAAHLAPASSPEDLLTMQQRLDDLVVALRCDDASDLDRLRAMLEDMGATVSHDVADADMIISAATDVRSESLLEQSRHATQGDVPFLPIGYAPDGSAWIGPIVSGRNGACLECALDRRGVTSGLDTEQLPPAIPRGTQPPLALRVSALAHAAGLALELAATGPSDIVSTVWRMRLGATTTERHYILRVPRCNGCSRPSDRPMVPWQTHSIGGGVED